MSTPPPSQKDADQVLRYSFDDASGSLRTNATIVADSIILSLDSADDSVAIGNSNNSHQLLINSDGSINIDAASLPLPTLASTSTLQVIANTSLSTINTTLGTPMQNTGGTVTANAGTGNFNVLETSQTVTGSIIFGGNQTVNFNCASMGTVRLQLQGNFNGGIEFLGSTDGVNFQSVFGIDDFLLNGQIYNNNSSSSDTPNGTWKFDVNGLATLRITAVGSGSSGTTVVTMIGTQASSVLTGSVGNLTVHGFIGIEDPNTNILYLGANTEANSVPVTIASDQYTSTTSTVTSVSSSATVVTLLALNASRKGAVLYNNSTQICYMKLGSSATSASFTIAMIPGATFIMNSMPLYTGIITGIWANANGAMLVTELT